MYSPPPPRPLHDSAVSLHCLFCQGSLKPSGGGAAGFKVRMVGGGCPWPLWQWVLAVGWGATLLSHLACRYSVGWISFVVWWP